MPLVAIAAASVGATLLLPSLLRPPPERSPSSAALSPDAPPDEDPDAIVQSLRQASSRTAGATGDVDAAPTTTVPLVEKPSRGQCFGDPPRQVESLYAAPCRAAFVGDNGGATYKNVSGEEIRLAIWHPLVSLPEGPISDDTAGETAAKRTLRVLQAYFNKNYELYGRRLQLIYIAPTTSDDAGHRATAVRADEEWRAFVSIYLAPPYCDEMARRGLVTFCNNLSGSFYEPRDPHVWSLMPDLHTSNRIGVEYVCKKLLGKPAAFGGADVQQRERSVGVVVMNDPVIGGAFSSRDVIGEFKAQCGYTPNESVDYDLTSESGTAAFATAMTLMRQRQVTTIYISAQGGDQLQFMAAADGNAYYPEWFVPGHWAMDWNSFGQVMPATQSEHMFGIGVHEMARPLDETDCYRAYRTIEPTTAPDRQTCLLFFHDLISVANGLQEAGPMLNPDRFRDGLWSIGERLYPNEPWAMGGGFGPGDWTYIDNAAEIWWDNEATDPEQRRPGAWRWVRNGRRYEHGEIPVEDPLVFREGITQPSEAS